MMKNWYFTISGTGAGNETWETSGYLICEFPNTFETAMKASFEQLTQGKAVYGHPGVGCKGPYDILRVMIRQVQQ